MEALAHVCGIEAPETYKPKDENLSEPNIYEVLKEVLRILILYLYYSVQNYRYPQRETQLQFVNF